MESKYINTFNDTLALFRKTTIKIRQHFFKEMESHKIGPQHVTILFFLRDENSLKMREIAKKIGLSNSAITYLIDKLEQEKYIKRCSCQSDRRATLIQITDRGRELVVNCEDQHFNYFKKTFNQLKENEQEHVINFYKQLVANINEELEHEES